MLVRDIQHMRKVLFRLPCVYQKKNLERYHDTDLVKSVCLSRPFEMIFESE